MVESTHQRHTAQIPEALTGQRLDQALASLFSQYSRTAIKQWIENGLVTVNLAPAGRPSCKVKFGDKIEFIAALEASVDIRPQAVRFEIVYSDDAVIVVDKPSGLVVHPGAGNPDRTLVNGLLSAFPELVALPRAGLIHRIDKDTSGLLIVGRDSASFQAMVRALSRREISRRYDAIVNGVLVAGGTIDAAITRDPRQRTRMRVADSGRSAVTHFRVRERFRAHTLIEVQLETGRTHQIRVHMASRGHPIVGDPKYGGRRRLPPSPSAGLATSISNFSRQALHARRLEFVHPVSNEKMSFEAPLPDDMSALISALERDLAEHGNKPS
ncbi:MAG: 23S rRNA pseudouridine(1911/1915/1917) synthase RluD [Proteobacteria bacterium]|nr:23S rRNA pseudouridine(1911/1915/1917) synthase RluD [Pseudomonadota bacterium]